MSGDGPEVLKAPGRLWTFPSWRRIGDFVVSLAQLERSYQSLKATNDQLREELKRLQRDVDGHSGQLDVLTTFVQRSLDNHPAAGSVDKRADPDDDS